MSKEDLLFDIADCQQGYFTSEQAKECGYYDSHFQRPILSGAWIKVGHGLYRLARYPLTERPDLVEWSLWSRSKKGEVQGVWSHETALDLYDLCDIMPTKLHMTVPKRFRKSVATPSVLKLYFFDLQQGDWVEQQGYRVTTPLRTLLDVIASRRISDEFIEQAVFAGRNKGLLKIHEINALPPTLAVMHLKELYERK